MTVRNLKKKNGTRLLGGRPSAKARVETSRARAGGRREYDPAQQAEEMLRTFSDRWEW